MTWAQVAAAEAVLIVGLILVVLAVANAMRAAQRDHARRHDLMLNQVLHLSGRTWTPPPASNPVPEPEDEFSRFVTAPSQLLDDED